MNIYNTHSSWQKHLDLALQSMDSHYLASLTQTNNWLPGIDHIFNAFSLPLQQVHYILLGESPYPRAQSANGYAFWDAAVKDIWSPTGLSKPVNRATSLRNIIKMLLVAEGALNPHHTSQTDIACIDKKNFAQTNAELFTHLLEKGFLLLNTSLVFQKDRVKKDARLWRPFLEYIVNVLMQKRPQAKWILFGRIAHELDDIINQPGLKKLCAEHPYNHSFITNEEVLTFFRPLHLLNKLC